MAFWNLAAVKIFGDDAEDDEVEWVVPSSDPRFPPLARQISKSRLSSEKSLSDRSRVARKSARDRESYDHTWVHYLSPEGDLNS